MSITIKKKKTWIKDSEGNYVSFDAVSDKTTADRIEDINSAAEEALSEISDAVASAPSNYTDLSNAVKALQNDSTAILTSKIDEIVGT